MQNSHSRSDLLSATSHVRLTGIGKCTIEDYIQDIGARTERVKHVIHVG